MKPIDKLLKILFEERGEKVPEIAEEDKFRYYRSLVNVRMPRPVSAEYLSAESAYLQEQLNKKGITDSKDLLFIDDIAVWQGDITTLKIDGIVNAANSRMLGCFAPCHACIDNCIHTFAGIKLRQECYEIMKKQGYEEPTGKAKITKSYNLPCKYVLHTVGPIVFGRLTDKDRRELASSYKSCLSLAEENRLNSIAFCCISTGEFHFPNEEAAKIAVKTVKEYKKENNSKIKVVFNVFKDLDYGIYNRLLERD